LTLPNFLEELCLMIFHKRLLIVLGVVCGMLLGYPARLESEPEVKETLAKVHRAYAKLKDLRAVIVTSYENREALEDIDSDFARAFEFKRITLAYKAPDKLRFDSATLRYVKVSVIVNKNRKCVRVPALHLSKRTTVPPDDPAKKQYPIDFGLPVGDIWEDWNIGYGGTGTVDGQECHIIKLLPPKPERARMNIWIDRALGVARRVDKIHSDGSPKFRILFKQFKMVGGIVLIPHRLEVYNPKGKLCGVMEYEKVSVNVGVKDSEFDID